MRSILIIRRGLLGDSVVAAPAIAALRRAFPDAFIALVSERDRKTGICWAEELFSRSGWVDRVVGFNGYNAKNLWQKVGALLGLIRHVAFRRWDVGICLDLPRNVGWEPILLRFLGARRVLGPSKGLDNARTREGGLSVSLPARDLLLNILFPLVSPIHSHTKDIPSLANPEEERFVDRWLSRQEGAPFPRPWVAVAPWANMPAKEWPLERYETVMRFLRQNRSLTPVLVAGPRDQKRGQAFLNSVGGGVLATGLKVREMWALLRRCALFVGNDSGPMHLAASAGVPCVALFSGRDALGLWEPKGTDHVVLRRRLPCEGCMLRECREKGMECLMEITAPDVERACLSRLSSEGVSRLSADFFQRGPLP